MADLSLFTRAICAFVSSPERATTGALSTGLLGDGLAGAVGGAVRALSVGMTTGSPAKTNSTLQKQNYRGGGRGEIFARSPPTDRRTHLEPVNVPRNV